MRVLVACEFSGTVRAAFTRAGHDATSCDLLPTDVPGAHHQGDVLDVLYGSGPRWDMLVAFPPCTDLAVSGARWWADKGTGRRDAALGFVRDLWEAPVPRVAIENPVGRLSTLWRKPDQIIQPWMFDHGETKATCLWLRGLPPLMVGVQSTEREARVHRMPPGPDRWRERSRTFQGIADAMAEQWGSLEEAA